MKPKFLNSIFPTLAANDAEQSILTNDPNIPVPALANEAEGISDQ